MRSTKLLLFFWGAFLYGCAEHPRESSVDTGSLKDATKSLCFSYPSSIDSLHLDALYDSARWVLYTWHCDIVYKPKKDSMEKETRSFGMLPMLFDTFIRKSDTVELYFKFLDGKEAIIPFDLKDYVHLKNGVGYNMKTGEKLYLISPDNYTINQKGKTSRFENPLQPEVIKYIDDNWNKLDTCFKLLAKERGLNRN